MRCQEHRKYLYNLHNAYADYARCHEKKGGQSRELGRLVGVISLVGLAFATITALNLAGLKTGGIQLCPHGDPTALVVSLAVTSLFPLYLARGLAMQHRTLLDYDKRVFEHDSDVNGSLSLPPFSATLVRMKDGQKALYIREGSGKAYSVSDFYIGERHVTASLNGKEYLVIQNGRHSSYQVYLFAVAYNKEMAKKAYIREGGEEANFNPEPPLYSTSLEMEATELRTTDSESRIQAAKLMRRFRYFEVLILLLGLSMGTSLFIGATSLAHVRHISLPLSPGVLIALTSVGGTFLLFGLYQFGKMMGSRPSHFEDLTPRKHYNSVEEARAYLNLKLKPFAFGFVEIRKKWYLSVRLKNETLLMPVYKDDKALQGTQLLAYNRKKMRVDYINKAGKRSAICQFFLLNGPPLQEMLYDLAS
jgi:hypothetical protein